MIGVNKYQPTERGADRGAQSRQFGGAADAARQAEAAEGRTRSGRVGGGAGRPDPRADRGNGNLLALAIDAARAKATVGEISDALEKVFGRHVASIKAITGVYKREVGKGGKMTGAVERVRKQVEPSKAAEGRRPRLLVAKIGAGRP